MSLTILLGKPDQLVAIVRWYLDPKFNILYASGPPVELTATEFAEQGFAFAKDHFATLEHHRIAEGQVVPVFQPGAARAYLKNRVPIDISRDSPGSLTISRLQFDRWDLGALSDLAEPFRRRIPECCSESEFWAAIEEAKAAGD